MASSSPTTSSQDGKEPLIPGGTDSQDLDSLSRDSNSHGGEVATGEQGSNPNLRNNGGSGTGQAQASRPQGDRELPEPTTEVQAFTTSDNILQVIAQRWDKARELNKVGAFRQLQRDLMNAAPYIVPNIIPYKDLIGIVTDLEKEIKGSTAQVGRSNEELLASFLSGKDGIPISVVPSPPPDLDIDVTIPVGDEDSSIAEESHTSSGDTL